MPSLVLLALEEHCFLEGWIHPPPPNHTKPKKPDSIRVCLGSVFSSLVIFQLTSTVRT